eukprot:scaffold147527_cov34-Tisochrysis_lutea.AAC.4
MPSAIDEANCAARCKTGRLIALPCVEYQRAGAAHEAEYARGGTFQVLQAHLSHKARIARLAESAGLCGLSCRTSRWRRIPAAPLCARGDWSMCLTAGPTSSTSLAAAARHQVAQRRAARAWVLVVAAAAAPSTEGDPGCLTLDMFCCTSPYTSAAALYSCTSLVLGMQLYPAPARRRASGVRGGGGGWGEPHSLFSWTTFTASNASLYITTRLPVFLERRVAGF